MDHSKPHASHVSGRPTYTPLILILGGILLTVLVIEWLNGSFDISRAMRDFMSLFFLTFGAFKLVDLSGFVDMYAQYDIITKRVRAWGFLYPFFELSLGLAYVLNADPILTNIATILLMGIGTVGIVQALTHKKRIRCACLGAVVKLPMSTVTLIEDVGMGLMAVMMLVLVLL